MAVVRRCIVGVERKGRLEVPLDAPVRPDDGPFKRALVAQEGHVEHRRQEIGHGVNARLALPQHLSAQCVLPGLHEAFVVLRLKPRHRLVLERLQVAEGPRDGRAQPGLAVPDDADFGRTLNGRKRQLALVPGGAKNPAPDCLPDAHSPPPTLTLKGRGAIGLDHKQTEAQSRHHPGFLSMACRAVSAADRSTCV